MSEPNLIPDSVRRIFTEGFRVGDIAEPLVSFDESASVDTVAAFMDEAGFDAVGVRRRGRIAGFVERARLGSGVFGDFAIAFDGQSSVSESAPLSSVATILSRQPRVFVTAFGDVAGIVTREDLEKPPVRMWLFGVVTLIEMRYARLIEETCPGDSWRQYLSEGRIAKAESLLSERRRRQQSVALLDCLQLSDKGQIVARNEQIRRQTIFTSRSQAEEGIKMLESLRNNLAHAQEIVASNWDAIERLAQHLDEALNENQTPEAESSCSPSPLRGGGRGEGFGGGQRRPLPPGPPLRSGEGGEVENSR